MLNLSGINNFESSKILNLETCAKVIASLKKNGKIVGLCHGGFDLLHPGHIIHLESASKLCDILAVSLTSDRFVSVRKGDGRPIYNEKLRAYAVASLECVDYVVISDSQKGIGVIYNLKPSLYIKGPDYINKRTLGIIEEREAIRKVGGKMAYTNDPKLSTTEIINYIKNEIK